jgi:FAD/FMN-containing dehydrogenase
MRLIKSPISQGTIEVTSQQHLLAHFEEIIGPKHVVADESQLRAHAVNGLTPWAVLFPGSPEEVSQCVHLAFTEQLAMVPWGGGSKISIGNPPVRLDVVLGTRRMDRIIDMDTANLTVTAQAGVRWRDLKMSLAEEENRCYLPLADFSTRPDQEVCSDRKHSGCFVPIVPPHDNRATLGGIIAANSIGPTALRYGLPRDVVLGIRFVGWEGHTIGVGGKTVKNVSGYDISKLMIGSLGTLGVICEMTLKLLPLPERSVTFLLSSSSSDSASDLTDQILGSRLLPAAVELLNPVTSHNLPVPPFPGGGYTVAVLLEGFEEAVQRMLLEVTRMGQETGAEETHLLQDESHRTFWHAHSNITETLGKDYPYVVTLRLNYPVGQHREAIRLVESLAAEHGIPHALSVHGGSGIARVHLLPPPNEGRLSDPTSMLTHNLIHRFTALGGNLVVEGAAPELIPLLPMWGAIRSDAFLMKRIKKEMDPGGIFSPGRFLGGI